MLSQLDLLEEGIVDSQNFSNLSSFDNDVIQKLIRYIRNGWELLYEDIKYRKYKGKYIKLGMGATSIVYKGFLKERDGYGDIIGNNKIPIAIKEYKSPSHQSSRHIKSIT